MAQPGLISNLMHDTKNEGDIIRVSHPYGDFFLDLESGDNSPLVLVSGGIGVTPLLSILNTLVSQNVERPVSWIQGARSAHVRAFTEHIKSLAAPRQNLQVRLYEDQPEQDEVEGKDYDVKGFIDLKDLDYERTLFLNNPQTQYFVCGPVQFMSIMESSLLQLGVDQSKIRMERFGTGGLARAA
jgi:nitric oxide dioxygenase